MDSRKGLLDWLARNNQCAMHRDAEIEMQLHSFLTKNDQMENKACLLFYHI